MKAYLLRTEAVRSAAAQKAVLVLAGVGILAASAWLSVPFFPVPLTMQTLAVLLIGGMLGPALGVSAVAGYLALGAAGAPVFHGGLGGVLVLAGPTGGYLIGFLPAVFLMGWAARIAGPGRSGDPADAAGLAGAGSTRASGSAYKRLLILALGAIVASAAIYALGVPWLSLVGGLGLDRAVAVGLVPFLLGDALKAAVAVGAVYLGGRTLSRWRPSLF
jgi:biotin transport system substrate-specific component